MVCARCAAPLRYGDHIRSRYTGRDYCRDYSLCTKRVLALLDGKEEFVQPNDRAKLLAGVTGGVEGEAAQSSGGADDQR